MDDERPDRGADSGREDAGSGEGGSRESGEGDRREPDRGARPEPGESDRRGPAEATGTAEETGTAGAVLALLREAAREHRPYVLFAAGLFLLGVVAGAAMVGRVDLFAAMGIGDVRDLLPERVTAVTILLNNTRALVVMVLGALSLGVLTALALVFNGLIVGYVAGGAAAQRGLGFVLLALLPHGVLELPAVFVAGGVAFRIVHATALRVLGRREVVLGREGWKRTGALLGAAWVALVIAAFVEFYVTAALLRAVFGSA